jgi:hypothetical protein
MILAEFHEEYTYPGYMTLARFLENSNLDIGRKTIP